MNPEQVKEFLSLITTATLIAELETRFEHLVIAGMTERPIENNDHHHVIMHTYSGAPFLCVSLAALVIHKCQHDINGSVTEMSVDDL